MDKRSLLFAAFKAGEYKRKRFVISLFSLINEAPAEWQKDITPYRIIQTPTAYFFIDPNNNNEIYPIDDAVAGQPLFNVKDTLTIKAGEIPNVTEDITTTYGRLLFNYVVLIYSFNDKIPYINYKIKASQIENILIPLFKDTPEKDEDRSNKYIYVDEYLKFTSSMFYLTAFTQLCVPGVTAKLITPAPGMDKLKAKLLEQYKDTLNDPETISKIDAELVAYDKEYIKGDLGEGFLIKGDAYSKVRKKLFSMHGAEVGLEEATKLELIKNSLNEGWDMNAFPEMNNSLRAGSYNRGQETMKGGEAFKWLQRSSSNINITIDDCGSGLGIVLDVNDTNYSSLVGFTLVTKEGMLKIPDLETAKKYIDKKVMMRSPMFCKVGKTDFCHTCVGENLSNNPTGASVAITGFGSTMMQIQMKKMHGQTLQLAKMDFKISIF